VPNLVRLLREGIERPSRAATKQGDELASIHRASRLKAPRRRVIGAIFGLLLCFAVIAALIGLSK